MTTKLLLSTHLLSIFILLSMPILGHSKDGTSTAASALETFNSGFKSCLRANTLKSKNLEKAKKEYQKYLILKERALTLEPALENLYPEKIKDGLSFCSRIEERLLREELGPLLSERLTLCTKAHSFMETNQFDAAQEYINDADALLEKMNITDSQLTSTDSLQIGSCGNLKKKMAFSRQYKMAFESDVNSITTFLLEARNGCENVSLALAANNEHTLTESEGAYQIARQAQLNALAQADFNQYIAYFPESFISKQLGSLVTQTNSCLTGSKHKIYSLKYRQFNKAAKQLNSKLQTAIKHCKTANKLLSSNESMNSTEHATELLYDSLYTKLETDKHAPAINLPPVSSNTRKQITYKQKQLTQCLGAFLEHRSEFES